MSGISSTILEALLVMGLLYFFFRGMYGRDIAAMAIQEMFYWYFSVLVGTILVLVCGVLLRKWIQ
jgi:hypothetical protein